jgi:hypothetical protein
MVTAGTLQIILWDSHIPGNHLLSVTMGLDAEARPMFQ